MLQELRRLIKTAAPKAEEKINYGMPFYEYHGRLVYFAGYKSHIGLYGLGRAMKTYEKELKNDLAAKSTVRFPIDRPLPVALLRKLIKAKVNENEAKAQALLQAGR